MAVDKDATITLTCAIDAGSTMLIPRPGVAPGSAAGTCHPHQGWPSSPCSMFKSAQKFDRTSLLESENGLVHFTS